MERGSIPLGCTKFMPPWTNWQSRFSQKEEFSRFNSEWGYHLSVVQWIEHVPPKNGMQVRFLLERPKRYRLLGGLTNYTYFDRIRSLLDF